MVGLILVLAGSAYAQLKNDRDRDGLRGTVHTVRIEKAWATVEDGKIVEGARGIPAVHTYEVDGRKVTIAYYEVNGAPGNKLVYVRATDARVTQLVHYSSDGKPFFKTVFSHDDQGNVIEENDYHSDGKRSRWSIFSYDHMGSRISAVSHGDDDAVLRRDDWKYSYDKQGNITEIACYYEKNYTKKVVYKYDDKGNVVEKMEYGDNERPLTIVWSHARRTFLDKESYVYEFDQHGNWTRQIMSRWDTQTDRYEPIEITYRTIAYR